MNLILVLTDQYTRKFRFVGYSAWMTACPFRALCLHYLPGLSLLLIDVVLDLALVHNWES